MFSAAPSSFTRPQSFANAYRTVGLETGVNAATPHRLVQMLFDGYMDALTQARAAMGAGHLEVKGRAIGRAVRIIEEGLKAGLDLGSGGSLAADLRDLYAYVVVRLMHANLHNDVKALDQCRSLIEPLRSAWESIAPQVAGLKN